MQAQEKFSSWKEEKFGKSDLRKSIQSGGTSGKSQPQLAQSGFSGSSRRYALSDEPRAGTNSASYRANAISSDDYFSQKQKGDEDLDAFFGEEVKTNGASSRKKKKKTKKKKKKKEVVSSSDESSSDSSSSDSSDSDDEEARRRRRKKRKKKKKLRKKREKEAAARASAQTRNYASTPQQWVSYQ